MTVDHRGLGIWLGFPPCCIEAFITDTKLAPWSLYDALVKSGCDLGHRPCKKCGEEIGRIGWDTYISSRITPYREAPEPYPTCDPSVDVPQFYT